jgi:hypothetical protein
MPILSMKNVLPFIILFLLTYHGLSQTERISQNALGIKAGGTTSRMYFDPAIDQRIIFGYTAGLVFNHRSEKPYGVQAELAFTQWGWAERLDSTSTYMRKLNYIHLPFLTHLRFGNENTNLIINLGPYVNYLVFEKEDINLIEGQASRAFYNKAIDNALGYGLSVGIGICLKTSLGIFQMEGRLNQGLSDIFKNTQTIPLISSKSQAVEVSLFYLIPLNY